jgi:hypothetical protein
MIGGQLAFVPSTRLHETSDEDWDLKAGLASLASPFSAYITGQSIVLDGGATAVGPFPPLTR